MTDVPRGIEVLIKKASVDPDFRKLLLERRAEAAEAIRLPLDPAEAQILNAISDEQLEAIIARTKVPSRHRAVFLGACGVAMLLLLGAVVSIPMCATMGISPSERRRLIQLRRRTEQAEPATRAQPESKEGSDGRR